MCAPSQPLLGSSSAFSPSSYQGMNLFTLSAHSACSHLVRLCRLSHFRGLFLKHEIRSLCMCFLYRSFFWPTFKEVAVSGQSSHRWRSCEPHHSGDCSQHHMVLNVRGGAECSLRYHLHIIFLQLKSYNLISLRM